MTLHARISWTLLGLLAFLSTGMGCRPLETGVVPTDRSMTPTPERTEPTLTPSTLPPTDTPVRPRTVPPPGAKGSAPTATARAPSPATDPVEQARADLAQRTGVDPAQIRIIQVRADEFPASNLGCPGKELRPIPAIVSGVEIVLTANGREHVYRARKGELVYCGPQP